MKEPKVIFCPEHTYGLEGCTYCATHDTTRPQHKNIMKLKDLRVGNRMVDIISFLRITNTRREL